LNKKEFDDNCIMRWKLLEPKIKKYGPNTWRNYPLPLLLKLANDRLEEVIGTQESTGRVDIDNLIDAMNFCEFVLVKFMELTKNWGIENE